MVHPDRRKPGVVIESPTRVTERNLWQPPRVVPEPSWDDAEISGANLRRVPLPAMPEVTRHAGFFR